jgi:hypothetical protein
MKMKNYFLYIAMVFAGLFVGCKKEEAEKPKVTYETTSKAKPEVVSDTNQIEVADLPINMEGTNFLIHPIFYLCLIFLHNFSPNKHMYPIKYGEIVSKVATATIRE